MMTYPFKFMNRFTLVGNLEEVRVKFYKSNVYANMVIKSGNNAFECYCHFNKNTKYQLQYYQLIYSLGLPYQWIAICDDEEYTHSMPLCNSYYQSKVQVYDDKDLYATHLIPKTDADITKLKIKGVVSKDREKTIYKIYSIQNISPEIEDNYSISISGYLINNDFITYYNEKTEIYKINNIKDLEGFYSLDLKSYSENKEIIEDSNMDYDIRDYSLMQSSMENVDTWLKDRYNEWNIILKGN